MLAGTTAMTTAAAGDAARVGAVTIMDMAITNKRKGPSAPFTLFSIRNQLIHPEQRPTINQPFRLTTIATIAQPMPLTQRVFTSPHQLRIAGKYQQRHRASAMPKLSNT